MYGFQPKSARGKAVQQLADGGMVHSIKGMLGLRPKTREELLAADAKAQARNQEAAARVAERSAQQPAPATPAPPAAISDYSGMNAMQRREKEQGLKNGGMVKPRGFKAGGLILGPGTGTSDSIETEKRPGTFIMPADSTQAIGPEALEELGESEEMGEEAVPVRLSNGEFEFTPEEVQALGEAVLTVMRDATHERADGQQKAMPKAAGFAPRQLFADGGMIENDVTRVGNSYSGGNVGGSVSINGQAGAGTMSTVPAPVASAPATAAAPAASVPTPAATATPATTTATPAAAPAAPMGWAERNAQRDLQVTASSIMDSPERRAAQAKLSPTPAPVAPVAPTTPAVGGIQSATTAMDATKPKPFGAQPTSPFGFKPRGYADGGTVQDEQSFATGGSVLDPEELRKMIPQVEAMGYAQSPAAAPAPVAAPVANIQAGQPRSVSPSALYMQDRASEMREQVGSGNYAQAAGTAARTAVQGLGMYGVELADKAGTPLVNAARGFGRGVLGADANAAPSTPAAATAPAAPAPATNPPTTTSTAGAGRGVVNPSTVNPSAPAPSNAPAAAPEVMPGVYRHGRGQYSDNAAGMGMPANFTGQPSAQNMAAADALAARSQQESMGRALSAPAGFQPASVQTPVVRNSTNDWAARKALENMATAASSITNRPEWQSGSTTIAGSTRGPKGDGDPEGKVAAYKAALASDFALQQAQPGLDQTAMRENADITREGMQQDGATTRTGMQEQGSNTREAGRNALTAEELGLKRKAQGFQTRAAAQREKLRNTLIDPNATPEQRKQAQEYLQALAVSDKEPSPQYKSYVMPAIRNADGSTTEGGVYQENTRTGEGRWVKPQGDGQAQQGALPKVATPRDLAALKSGTRFVDSNGVERIKK